MDADKRYLLCNKCVEEGKKKYDIFLAGWERKMVGKCQRCRKVKPIAKYRLQEKGSHIFSMGAYVVERE